MPIYMDRHDVSEDVTAESVAQLHQADLKIQHKYGCRGLTYWFDDTRKTAFCLVEAPNKNAIIKMHKEAHGKVPHDIIEVDPTIVESFLGRIEDPEKEKNTHLIINDSAYRILMALNIEQISFINSDPFKKISSVHQIYKHINAILPAFDGSIVQQNEDGYLISFREATKAVLCALKIFEQYRTIRIKHKLDLTELSIGLHAGVPVTDKKSIFEDTIKMARRMCFISFAEIVITTEVQHLFERENFGEVLNRPQIHVLTQTEENFLNRVMEFTENKWQNEGIKVEDFEKSVGTSKTKLYREMIRLTGKSPNLFLLHFRLRKSLQLLIKQDGNISEIAFNSGFKNPSYYTRCFRKKYGIMPSRLLQK